jgi:hypothetical protein
VLKENLTKEQAEAKTKALKASGKYYEVQYDIALPFEGGGNVATIKNQIADFEKKMGLKSLPDSAKAVLQKKIDEQIEKNKENGVKFA